MGYACLGICLLLSIVAIKKDKRVYNPGFMFPAVLGFSTLLSLFNFASVKVNNWQTYLIVILGVVCFSLGCSLTTFYSHQHRPKNIERHYNPILYWILVVACLCFCTVLVRDPIKILLSGGSITDIYYARLATEFSGSKGLMYYTGVTDAIIQYIDQPLLTALIPISLCLYFEKLEVKYLFLSIIFEIIKIIGTGGRTSAIIFVIELVICMSIYKESFATITSIIRKRRNIFRLLFIISVAFVVYIFLSRGTRILLTVAGYYGFPIAHMEKRILSLNQYSNTYGMMTLQGIIRPFLRVVGIPYPESLSNATKLYADLQKGVNLGTGIGMDYNAFVTPFYFFFVDFQWAGVIAFSIIFGAVSKSLYLKAITYQNTGYISIFLISFCSPICFSIVRFQYVQQDIFYGIIITMLIFSKVKYVIKGDAKWRS